MINNKIIKYEQENIIAHIKVEALIHKTIPTLIHKYAQMNGINLCDNPLFLDQAQPSNILSINFIKKIISLFEIVQNLIETVQLKLISIQASIRMEYLLR